MLSTLRPAATLLALFTVVTGLAYPLAVTGAAQLLFPTQANGSLLIKSGRVVGSSLIGQSFDDAGYFWGRPSATSRTPYDASSSSGSNLGPTNPALADTVRARVVALRAADPQAEAGATRVPVDLVTASGSGLDPDVSPAAALYQVHRVAEARGITEAHVRALVQTHIEARTWELLGEPRVNVLKLNLALDALTRGGA